MAMRWVWLVVFGIVVSCARWVNAQSAKPRAAAGPNIVVILVDDLGIGDLSSYGAADLKTPHVDRLVERGMKFTNAYANCPVCSPTRASLLSGRYPELVGVPGVIRSHSRRDSWGWLSPDAVLLPTMLKRAGYHTAIVGKWHLGAEDGQRPTQRGFDFFHGFLGDMMDDYYRHRRAGQNYMRRDDETIDPEGHATDVFTDWAIEYIQQRSAPGAAAGKREPFFLYLAYNAPHTPIQPPQEWLVKVKARQPGMSDQRAKLVALIEHLDDGIGRVMQAIDAAGIAGETLVIFSSDNGGQVNVGGTNGPWRGGKQDLYEGGLRVPQCAVWPGEIAPGSTTDQVTLSMDLFATCCDAAGVEIDHAIDGVSILPTLRGEGQSIERDLFWTRREGNVRYMGQAVWAVRRGEMKLLQNSPTGPFELYDLKADPAEGRDLSTSNRGAYQSLGAALRAHMQRGGAVPWQPPAVTNP